MKSILKYLLIFNILNNLNAIDEHKNCLSNLALLYNHTNLILPDNVMSNIGIAIAMENLFKNLSFGPCYIFHNKDIFLKISIFFSFKQALYQYLEIGVYKNIFNNFLVGLNIFIVQTDLIFIKVSLLFRKKIHKTTGIININYITYYIKTPKQKFPKFTDLNIKTKQKNNPLNKLFHFRASDPNKSNLSQIMQYVHEFNKPTHILTKIIINTQNNQEIRIKVPIYGYYSNNFPFSKLIFIINNNYKGKLLNTNIIEKEILLYTNNKAFKLILEIFNKNHLMLYIASSTSSIASPLIKKISSTSFSSSINII